MAANVALVGAALGAYGTRMALAMLPHGPLELAAFATALALYLDARRGPLAIHTCSRSPAAARARSPRPRSPEVFLVP